MNDIDEMDPEPKVRELNVAEEESLNYITSDHNKIEVGKLCFYFEQELRELLEDSLGV